MIRLSSRRPILSCISISRTNGVCECDQTARETPRGVVRRSYFSRPRSAATPSRLFASSPLSPPLQPRHSLKGPSTLASNSDLISMVAVASHRVASRLVPFLRGRRDRESLPGTLPLTFAKRNARCDAEKEREREIERTSCAGKLPLAS